MHNLSMAENLLNAVLSETEKHEGGRIKRISVLLDDHDFAEAEAMQFCFEAIAVGTRAEGAELKVERFCKDTNTHECSNSQTIQVQLK